MDASWNRLGLGGILGLVVRNLSEVITPPSRTDDVDRRRVGERSPFPPLHGARGGRPARRFRHVLRHRALVDVVSEHRELARNGASAPERIVASNAPDQLHEIESPGGPTDPSGLPRPETSEAAPMPSGHGRRLQRSPARRSTATRCARARSGGRDPWAGVCPRFSAKQVIHHHSHRASLPARHRARTRRPRPSRAARCSVRARPTRVRALGPLVFSMANRRRLLRRPSSTKCSSASRRRRRNGPSGQGTGWRRRASASPPGPTTSRRTRAEAALPARCSYQPNSTPPVPPTPLDAPAWKTRSYSGSTQSPMWRPHGQNMKSSAASPPKYVPLLAPVT
jgi:hypothetical protein